MPIGTISRYGGAGLAVRIGIHTGEVVIADGGEVFGEGANVAARVQNAAKPSTVVITEATQRLIVGMFVVEDLGPQSLKGVRETIRLYRAGSVYDDEKTNSPAGKRIDVPEG